MVERTVCSTPSETSSNVSLTSVRNDVHDLHFVLEPENKNSPILLEPEVTSGRTGRFSLFKWFKRGNRESSSSTSTIQRRQKKLSGKTQSSDAEIEGPEDPEDSSSTESVDTSYSTATVRSFAFHSGTLRSGDESATKNFGGGQTSLDLVNHTQRKVGPFGAGAAKLVVKKECKGEDESSDVTRTLPASALSRKKDITARYSLQPCAGFGSCGNFRGGQRVLSGSLRRLDERGTGRRVHVRGKRRAPNPPSVVVKVKGAGVSEEGKFLRGSGRRKRRPAPKPPETNSVVVNQVNVKVNDPQVEKTHPKTSEDTSAVTAISETNPKAKDTLVTPAVPPVAQNCVKLNDLELKQVLLKTSEGTSAIPASYETKEKAKDTFVTSVVSPVASISPKLTNKEVINVKRIPKKTSEEISAEDTQVIWTVSPLSPTSLEAKDKGVEKTPSNTSEKSETNLKVTLVTSSVVPVSPNSVDLNDKVKELEETLVTSLVSPVAATTVNYVTPETCETQSESSKATLTESISNDTLILQGGVLHSKKEATLTPVGKSSASGEKESSKQCGPSSRGFVITTGCQTSAMPRPWYKRSVFEHSRDSTTTRRGDVLRNPTPLDLREDNNTTSSFSSSTKVEKNHGEGGGTLSRLTSMNFFHRSERGSEERRKENKRKSGISILTNISELDKEAAAIVYEEQARNRAASMLLQASRIQDQERLNDRVNEEVVQGMVTSAMESSPRRGTRALISKFNAIGNITKVTVNSSFFSRSSYGRDQGRRDDDKVDPASRNSRHDDLQNRSHFQQTPQNVRVEKDLSRYFPPQQGSPKNRTTTEIQKEVKPNTQQSPKNSRASRDISARLSFLQSTVNNTSAVPQNSHSHHPIETQPTLLDSKISRLTNEVVVREEKTKNSPKLSRLQHHVINTEPTKSHQNESDETKSAENETKKNLEVIQKEFSSIFNEIDKQLAPKQFQVSSGSKDLNKKKIEPGTSSQVSRVLDILVEAEKDEKLKIDWLKSSRDSQILKTKNSVLGTTEDPMKTDLKEMLKEMKHSLPKRPKPKRQIGTETKKPEELKEPIAVENKTPKTSYLLNSVTVVYPPPIRIGPPVDLVTRMIPGVEEREYDKQKVSSSAQTSGNVRMINRQMQPSPGSPKWRNEDVIYKTSGKGVATPGTSGLVKNSFQLIRPREFAQIEAVKTLKSNNRGENTYANVIGQSLYANANVPRKVPVGLPAGPSRSSGEERREAKISVMAEKRVGADNKESIESSETHEEAQETRVTVDHQNMNTLAVNRLLRKLEAAIGSGHHQQAAGLAKELARLKIHCSVVRQRTKAKDVLNVNMYIEDKLAHQGPIPLRLTRSMTIAQLKAKVFTEFEIPPDVQRWIIGKNLVNDDDRTLEELQTVDGSTVFLYLVAPELKNGGTPARNEKAPLAEEEPPLDPVPEPVETINIVTPTKKDEDEDEDEEDLTETQIIKEEEEEECISEEVRMERYEALISLENCDVIPNSESIECPICFVTYGPQEGVILRDCLHMFCRPCIANTIRYCEEAEVKCPFRDTEYTCESTMQEREIKALVEPEVYQQHLAKSIAQAENNAGNNAFHCKTPDCPGWCIYDDNVNHFLCPVCGVRNCLTCQVVHTGRTCRQYQQDLRSTSTETNQESKRTAEMLEEMVDRGEALRCPTCAVVLMKKWGCDWLRCSMCKTEICWVTRGPRWGPGGKGDTSGGCRCGERGVKCHPRCNYCH